jgi:hypothetical protein
VQNCTSTQITKNILNVGNLSERRLHWISYVDEYGPTLHCIEDPQNVIADTFSRLLHKDLPSALVGKKAAHIDSNSESNNEIESLGSSLTDGKGYEFLPEPEVRSQI